MLMRHTGRQGGTAGKHVRCRPSRSTDHEHTQGTWCSGSTRRPAAVRPRRLSRRTGTAPVQHGRPTHVSGRFRYRKKKCTFSDCAHFVKPQQEARRVRKLLLTMHLFIRVPDKSGSQAFSPVWR